MLFDGLVNRCGSTPSGSPCYALKKGKLALPRVVYLWPYGPQFAFFLMFVESALINSCCETTLLLTADPEYPLLPLYKLSQIFATRFDAELVGIGDTFTTCDDPKRLPGLVSKRTTLVWCWCFVLLFVVARKTIT